MSKSNNLTSEDYYQITRCMDHCIDEARKLRFVSTDEWQRLSTLREKVEQAYNAARAKEGDR